ncbi:hypothetical protein [Bosea sp. 124]|uniref:hypothetical protein n=1 Tax=Bosea sp. 124 TaxID=2135642 RepID=UPI0011B1D09C|nr:hypothetical protein [Bosea sp. 124]
MSPKIAVGGAESAVDVARTIMRAVMLHFDAFAASKPAQLFKEGEAIALSRSTRDDSVVLSIIDSPENWAHHRHELNYGRPQYVSVRYQEEINLIEDGELASLRAFDTHIDNSLQERAREVFDRARAALAKRQEASERAASALQDHQRIDKEVEAAVARSNELLRKAMKLI